MLGKNKRICWVVASRKMRINRVRKKLCFLPLHYFSFFVAVFCGVYVVPVN